MKEALKMCVAELRKARGEVEEVMHNCAAALAGTEKGAGRVAEYRRQLARIDAAVAAAEAAMAQPDPEPVARRHGGAVLFRLRGFTVPLYAGSALAQSAHPLELPTPEMLRAAQLHSAVGSEICANWSSAYDAITELWRVMAATAPTQSAEMAAVTAERDQLRAEVERLQRGMALLTDERIRRLWLSACNDVTERLPFMAFARLLEREHSITAPFAVIDPTQGGRS